MVCLLTSSLLILCFLETCYVSAQFAILPPGTVANTSTVVLTTDCVGALEATVQCNSSLGPIAASDYHYGQVAESYSALCMNTCNSSLAAYHNNVTSACNGQPQPWPGLPATYFGDILWATFNMTCLQDLTTQEYCMTQLYNVSASYPNDTAATDLHQSVLCTNCVLSMLSLLQGTAYSYYDSDMASDWSVIQSSCSVSYPTAVQTNPTNVTSINGFAPAGYTTPTSCFSGNTYTVASDDSCATISQKEGVSTGALISLNNLLPDCSNIEVGSSLCLPATCTTYTVQSNDSCESILNTTDSTMTQMYAWNPTINTYCTNLVVGQQVCVVQPGTVWNGTTIVGASPIQTGVYATTTVPVPTNIADGTTTDCGKYYVINNGDDCSLVALNNTVQLSLFEAINPSIDSNCSNLVVGLAYCVFPEAIWNATVNGTTTSTYVSAPGPTPTGTTDDCYEWHTIVDGDDCTLIQSEYGIPFEEIEQWNPNLNSTCRNLILGYAYCVDGQASSTSASVTVATSTTASSGGISSATTTSS